MSIGAGGALQSPSILSVSDRNVPRSHVQFAAPAYDVDFSGHGIQLPTPLMFLYVPAGHSKIQKVSNQTDFCHHHFLDEPIPRVINQNIKLKTRLFHSSKTA